MISVINKPESVQKLVIYSIMLMQRQYCVAGDLAVTILAVTILAVTIPAMGISAKAVEILKKVKLVAVPVVNFVQETLALSDVKIANPAENVPNLPSGFVAIVHLRRSMHVAEMIVVSNAKMPVVLQFPAKAKIVRESIVKPQAVRFAQVLHVS
jgi:hypothetical protein